MALSFSHMQEWSQGINVIRVRTFYTWHRTAVKTVIYEIFLQDDAFSSRFLIIFIDNGKGSILTYDTR